MLIKKVNVDIQMFGQKVHASILAFFALNSKLFYFETITCKSFILKLSFTWMLEVEKLKMAGAFVTIANAQLEYEFFLIRHFLK